MKKIICLTLALAWITSLSAQRFEDFFNDATLRLDYIFMGNKSEQHIALDQLSSIPKWYGKKQRLAEVPVEGNGQIYVIEPHTGQILYRNSFSTLFQEWLSYDESKTQTRSFENVFLVPMPKDTVIVTVELKNNRREVTARLSHLVVPKDILIKKFNAGKHTPYEILNSPADPDKCIHIAYVAEGYTEEEMQTFIDDAMIANEALFSHEPFKSMKDKFLITAVKSVSQDSGTSEPANGIWRNTVLGSSFDTFYSSRYLTTLHLKDLHDVLAGTPYEHIIVLVNTEKYGGGGILNSYNLSMTHHKLYRPVVVHEFGHSFAGLADEYAYENEPIPMYPHDIEPWEQNITTLTRFDDKWQDMVSKKTNIPTTESKDNTVVGAFEGAGYSLNGVYRPMYDCRMRTNENPEFCEVCKRAIKRLIEFYTE